MDIETCRACAMKHLSDALVWLNDKDTQEVVRNAYISGNLSHASGHLLSLSSEAANSVRETRLRLLDDALKLRVSIEEAVDAIKADIELVSELSTKVEETEPKKAVGVYVSNSAPKKSGGCGCGKKH